MPGGQEPPRPIPEARTPTRELEGLGYELLMERYRQLEDECYRLRSKLKRERNKVRAIQEISSALGSSLEINEILERVLAAITRLLDADRSSLFLLDEHRRHLVATVSQGEFGREIRLRVGEGIAGWVARTGRPVNLKDAYQDPRFNPAFDRLTGYRTRSMLCVPVPEPRRHNRTIGVIQVLNKKHGYFTVGDEELLKALSAQAGITIANSQLFVTVMRKNMQLMETQERLREKLRELDCLHKLSQELQDARTDDDLVAAVLEMTHEMIPCEGVAMLVADEEGGVLDFRVARVDEPIVTGRFRLAPGEGLIGRAIEKRAILDSDVIMADPSYRLALEEHTGITVRSTLVVPLLVDDEPLGAIQVINKKGGSRYFGSEERTLLSLIADQTARVMDLRRHMVAKHQEERLAAIGQLLSGVLHDLKGPISIISGYVQLMVRKDDRAERERYRAIIERQFEHLSSMTQEVLAFARGEVSLLVRKCYVNQFMDELAELFSRQVEGRGIKLTVRDEFKAVAYFDQIKIRRAISNLVQNSIEALGEGGHITLVASREGDDIVFTVSDDGPGIPEEIRGRLFDAFVSKGKAGGSGLGLAMVRKIVEEHHGSVSYESGPGIGTRFELRIPIEPPADQEAQGGR